MSKSYYELLESQHDDALKKGPQDLTSHALITAAGAINRNPGKVNVVTPGGVFQVNSAAYSIGSGMIFVYASPLPENPKAAPAVLPGHKVLPIDPGEE